MRAAGFEIYGDSPEPPPHAIVHFRGTDPHVGRLTKYTVVENRMPTRANPIDIPVDGKHIAGTLVGPDTMVPGVMLVHGWDGSQEQYIARAHEIATLGCICLTFDLRGHVRHQAQRETVSREDNLRDVLAAYDVLVGHPAVDPKRDRDHRQQLRRLPGRDRDRAAAGALARAAGAGALQGRRLGHAEKPAQPRGAGRLPQQHGVARRTTARSPPARRSAATC